MDVQGIHVYGRLHQALYAREGGVVYLRDIVSYMKDYGVNPQDAGKYIRSMFRVEVKRAKSQTTYIGISWKPGFEPLQHPNVAAPLASLSQYISSPPKCGPPTSISSPPQYGPPTSISSPPQYGPPTSISSPPECRPLPNILSPPQCGPPTSILSPPQCGPPTSISSPPQCGPLPNISSPPQCAPYTGTLPLSAFSSSFGPHLTHQHFQLIEMNTQLQARIHRLEEETASLKAQLREVGTLNQESIWKHVDNVLNQELVTISNSKSILGRKIQTLEDIRSLNIKDIKETMMSQAPQLFRIVKNLISTTYKADDSYSAIMLLSSITHARNQRSSILQIVISLFLLLTASQHQVIKLLNHTHQCVSFATAWKAIEEFADKAKAEQGPTESSEIWAYDNLNIMKRIRHVRKERHAEMHNWTTRVVVPIRNPPPADLSQEPQGMRQELTEAEILQSDEDTLALKESFVKRATQLLLQKFKAFNIFAENTSQVQSRVKKSTYTPLEVLDMDESKTSDNIRILVQFAEDRGVGQGVDQTVQDQVVLGDQATCKNIRGAKRLRQTETQPLQSLKWAKETAGDFHFLMEAGRAILLAFWSSPRNVGSIANLRDLVDRRTVDSMGKNFNAVDELLHHIEEAHLTAALLAHLHMQSTADDFHVDSMEQVRDLASDFVETVSTQPQVDDALYHLGNSLLYHLLLYTDLRQAIRNEDGEKIVQHWKFWLPLFLGTGRGNYSYESLNFLANLQAEWSPRTAHVATHNRTVNFRGKAGCGKAVDMLVEHYNRLLKSILKGSGGKLTIGHAQRVSLAIPLLDEARSFCVKTFGLSRTTSHTTRSASADIQEMVEAIKVGQVYTPQEGRQISLGKKFNNPMEKAFKRINDDKWIASALLKYTRKHTPDLDDVEVDTDILMDE